MYGLIRKADSTLDCIVDSTDGYDLTEFNVVEIPGDPMDLRWDGAQFVQRDPTPAEESDAALEADVRWQQLKGASPQQIETYLTQQVTDLASARRVLKILVLAVQRLARTR